MNKKICCEEPEIQDIDGQMTCINCGIISRSVYEKEINYNKPIIYKKNDYMRKKLLEISNNKTDDNDKIIEYFKQIYEILQRYSLVKKYSLNYNFIIYKNIWNSEFRSIKHQFNNKQTLVEKI